MLDYGIDQPRLLEEHRDGTDRSVGETYDKGMRLLDE